MKTARTRKGNGHGLNEQLTPTEVCTLAAENGVRITPNALALMRRDGKGPRYIVVNGYWIRYTRKDVDPLIESRMPRVVDPARRVAAS